MSGKNQYYNVFNWQAANPATGFLPQKYPYGSLPSGTLSGTMTGTNVIYSNIIDLSKMDNIGLEVAWTGTPVGTLVVEASNSGINFPPITFTPALTQPAGSATSFLISLQSFPWRYILLKYTNASGSGTLTAYGQNKDLN